MIYENPPSYDSATQHHGETNSSPLHRDAQTKSDKGDAQCQLVPHPAPAMQSGPCYRPPQQTTTVHHYMNPLTGEHVASVLPPDHPEMVCLQEGRHIRRTKFGLLGVLAAVFWFPLGIGLCLLDRRVRCERCGYILEDGIMCG